MMPDSVRNPMRHIIDNPRALPAFGWKQPDFFPDCWSMVHLRGCDLLFFVVFNREKCNVNHCLRC